MTDETIHNVAAFAATPWLITNKGAIHQNLLLTPDTLRQANIVALPLLDSHRMILAPRAHAQWIIDMGPWRLADEIVRESGHTLYGLYRSYLMICQWRKDYC